MREERLLAYLQGACLGRAYRVSGKELKRVMGLSGTDLRKIVNRLRRRGVPIASDQNGYFYAQTSGEVYKHDSVSRKNTHRGGCCDPGFGGLYG